MLNFSNNNIKGTFENWSLWKRLKGVSKSYERVLMLGKRRTPIGVPEKPWRPLKGS